MECLWLSSMDAIFKLGCPSSPVRISPDCWAWRRDSVGCDLNLIKLKGDRKTTLVELIPELTPTSRR